MLWSFTCVPSAVRAAENAAAVMNSHHPTAARPCCCGDPPARLALFSLLKCSRCQTDSAHPTSEQSFLPWRSFCAPSVEFYLSQVLRCDALSLITALLERGSGSINAIRCAFARGTCFEAHSGAPQCMRAAWCSTIWHLRSPGGLIEPNQAAARLWHGSGSEYWLRCAARTLTVVLAAHGGA